jgi:hypothetical protein
VVARPPKIGGIVKTVSRSQKAGDATVARTPRSSRVGWADAGAAVPSRAGRALQAMGIKAATATA